MRAKLDILRRAALRINGDEADKAPRYGRSFLGLSTTKFLRINRNEKAGFAGLSAIFTPPSEDSHD